MHSSLKLTGSRRHSEKTPIVMLGEGIAIGRVVMFSLFINTLFLSRMAGGQISADRRALTASM